MGDDFEMQDRPPEVAKMSDDEMATLKAMMEMPPGRRGTIAISEATVSAAERQASALESIALSLQTIAAVLLPAQAGDIGARLNPARTRPAQE